MGCLNRLKMPTFKRAGLQGSRRESHTGCRSFWSRTIYKLEKVSLNLKGSSAGVKNDCFQKPMKLL